MFPPKCGPQGPCPWRSHPSLTGSWFLLPSQAVSTLECGASQSRCSVLTFAHCHVARDTEIREVEPLPTSQSRSGGGELGPGSASSWAGTIWTALSPARGALPALNKPFFPTWSRVIEKAFTSDLESLDFVEMGLSHLSVSPELPAAPGTWGEHDECLKEGLTSNFYCEETVQEPEIRKFSFCFLPCLRFAV